MSNVSRFYYVLCCCHWKVQFIVFVELNNVVCSLVEACFC